MWTRKQIRQLQDQARLALGAIRRLFIDHVIDLGSGRYAWGQFFEESRTNRQHGIYGTSAGIQVISMAGDPTHAYVGGSTKFLSDALEDQSSEIYQRGDTAFLYKLAYIAEATNPDQTIINDNSAPMDELIKRMLPSGGWGEFYFSENDKDIEPKVTSTAAALLALSRYRRFRSTEQCERAFEWLCRRIPQDPQMGVYEVALASLALTEYRNERITGYDQAVAFCKQRLYEWTKSKKERHWGRTERHHYYTSSAEGGADNKYLYFPTHCLAALALLKWGAPMKTRRYILMVTRFFTKQVLEKKGFSPDTSRQIATVDHLWIYRLLNQFTTTPVDSVLPQPFYTWASFPVIGKVVIALIFFVAGYGAVYLSHKSNYSGWITALYAVIGSIGLTLFGRIIWESFKGRDS